VVPHGGTNVVSVNVDGNGFADGTFTVTTALTIGSVTSGSGSFAGGQEVTIGGSGFGDRDQMSVEICGSMCEYISHTDTEYTCSSPLMLSEFSYTEGLNDHVR